MHQKTVRNSLILLVLLATIAGAIWYFSGAGEHHDKNVVLAYSQEVQSEPGANLGECSKVGKEMVSYGK